MVAPARNAYRGHLVHRLFESQALHVAERIAIVEGATSITYRDLDVRANRLATFLRDQRGVRRHDRVAVMIDRSIEAIVAMLAIFKVGAAYVPIDISNPCEYIGSIFERANIGVAIVGEAARAGSFESVRIVAIDRDASFIDECSGEPITSDGDPRDVAYIMFTSGSTGTPKGVLISHRGITRLTVDANYLRVSSGDTVAHLSALTFDASTFEMWAALLCGARLAILAKPAILDPERLARDIARYDITIMFLTTSLFVQLVAANPALFAPLRALLVGGEVLPTATVRAIFDAARPQRVLNVYGPTETTTFAAFYEITDVEHDGDAIPIGRPISQTELYVLDDTMRPVGCGEVGQLYIGGAGVALGYLDAPEMTARKFLTNPFALGALYASGDLVRMRPDGELVFVGRLDRQRKIRGYRIEPSEIELRLCDHPNVAQAHVAFVAGIAGDRIVAYVRPNDIAAFERDSLREDLAGRLPAFMLPDHIVALASFPLKSSGKIDTHALPKPRWTSRDGEFVGATDDVESAIVRVWERVLGIAPIGIRDDFYDLGGTSIAAIAMLSELQSTFGKRIALDVASRDATIQQLAIVVRAEVVQKESLDVVILNSAGSEVPFVYLHGSLDGHGFYCREIAQIVGPDRPIILLRPLGIDGTCFPESIGHIAEIYTGMLERHGVRPPYALGGYSAGGLVAFEMARRLEKLGAVVRGIVLVDPPIPIRSFRPVRRFLQQLVLRVAGNEPRLALLMGHIARVPHHLRRWMSGPDTKCALGPDTSAITDLIRSWTRTCESYVPRPLSGAVTLLSTKQFVPDLDDIGDFARVVPHARVERIPGDHVSCITDHAAEVARAIERALARSSAVTILRQMDHL